MPNTRVFGLENAVHYPVFETLRSEQSTLLTHPSDGLNFPSCLYSLKSTLLNFKNDHPSELSIKI